MSRAGLFTPYARERDDWYVEEPVAVEALLDCEDLSAGVYDPACGCGTIPLTARARGIRARGTDIADRGFGRRRDFLAPGRPRGPIANIVCNPPYAPGLPEAFAAKALSLARGLVCLLLPFTWWSSEGRRDLFRHLTPARVRCFAYRVNMPPGRLLQAGLIEPKNGKQTYAWFIWDRSHPPGQPPLLYRIEREG